MDNLMLIALTEAKNKAKDEVTLEDKLKAAMKETKHHWLLTDEEGRFRSAIGAVILLTEGEDRKRLEDEFTALKILSASILSASLKEIPIDVTKFPNINCPIGILKMWADTK